MSSKASAFFPAFSYLVEAGAIGTVIVSRVCSHNDEHLVRQLVLRVLPNKGAGAHSRRVDVHFGWARIILCVRIHGSAHVGVVVADGPFELGDHGLGPLAREQLRHLSGSGVPRNWKTSPLTSS